MVWCGVGWCLLYSVVLGEVRWCGVVLVLWCVCSVVWGDVGCMLCVCSVVWAGVGCMVYVQCGVGGMVRGGG